MEILKKNSVIIFINRPIENIVKDIEISTRPLLADDPSKLFKLYEERYSLYKKYSDLEVLNNLSFQETVHKAVMLLQE